MFKACGQLNICNDARNIHIGNVGGAIMISKCGLSLNKGDSRKVEQLKAFATKSPKLSHCFFHTLATNIVVAT